jgi:hypothetical protein
MIRRLALLAAVTIALTVVPSTASARTFTYTDKISFQGYNECVPERIKFRGVAHSTFDYDGELVHSNLVIRLTGIGRRSGSTYHGVGRVSTVLQVTPGSSTTYTVEAHVLMISSGSTPNFIAHTLYHYTIVDGERTSYVFNFDVRCTG